MSDDQKLLPCPFCGGQASLCTKNRPYPWVAECDECGAVVGGSAFRNDQWNAHCWNTRTDHCATLIAEAVAAAYKDAAKVGSSWADQLFAVDDTDANRMITEPILARTPADALAARDARDKRMRDDALREAADICDGERHNTNVLTSNPPQSAAAIGARNIILALIDADG